MHTYKHTVRFLPAVCWCVCVAKGGGAESSSGGGAKETSGQFTVITTNITSVKQTLFDLLGEETELSIHHRLFCDSILNMFSVRLGGAGGV